MLQKQNPEAEILDPEPGSNQEHEDGAAFDKSAVGRLVQTCQVALGSFGEKSLKCLSAASTLNSELNFLSLTSAKPWTYTRQSSLGSALFLPKSGETTWYSSS